MSGANLRSNVQASQGRDVNAVKHAQSRRAHRKNDRGFTLIELLIVITIIPIIIGALAGGLLEVFSLQSGVTNRIGDSASAQVIAATFTKDVQSALEISTNASPTYQCGTGTDLLDLQWGGSLVIVSYSEQQYGTTYSLVRNYCSSGASQTPTSSSVLSYDLLAPCPFTDTVTFCNAHNLQPAPVTYAGASVVDTTSAAAVTTTGMTSIQFPILEQGSSYTYQLSATPAAGASTAVTNLGLPHNGFTCGFALPGTGDYANTMCFIGFTTTQLQAAYPNGGSMCTATDPSQQGVDTYVDVPGGYLMSFCLTVAASQSAPLVAVSTPVGGGTCAGCDAGSISNGQGYLGNDDQVPGQSLASTPFYAGIGCPVSTPVLQNGTVTSSCINPAIFQTANGSTDSVTLSDIQVTDPQGTSATGYEVITADAETIDPGGYIQWTSSSPASKPLPFNLVPNFNNSDLGNACNQVPTPINNYAGAPGWAIDDGDTSGAGYAAGLTGLGTATVECQSNWQTNSPYLRTGTAMLGITPLTVSGSAEPVTISAQLKGEGYNAVAFGLLLP
jgi:prepilin-type N-terminal cleavage/methylation domain-containing protein